MSGIELAIAVGGLSAATSAYGAAQQNAAAKRGAASQRRAAQVQANQVATQAQQAQFENRRTADQIAARTRVLAIASGAGGGDSIDDINRTLALDAGRNAATIQANRLSRTLAIESGVNANLASLQAQTRAALLDTLSGGLSGFSTGLSISRSLE